MNSIELTLSLLWTASWQGAIVLGVAFGVCRLFRRMPASARCWVWRLAYLKLLIGLVPLAAIELPVLPAAPIKAAPVAAMAPSSPYTLTLPGRYTVLGELLQDSGTPSEAHSVIRPAVATAAAPTYVPAMLGVLALFWAVGAAWQAGSLIVKWAAVRRLIRAATPVNDPEMVETSLGLCRRLGIRRAPRLMVTESSGSPMLFGLLRPVVILPAAALSASSGAEQRLILAHELAHLKRGDLLWNWLPAAAQVLFFFHPLVWRASRSWLLAQEMATDELAVLRTSAALDDYAAMLVRIAASCSRRPGALITASVIEAPHTLRRRLFAMRYIHNVSRGTLLGAGSILGLAAVVGILPWRPVAAAAQEPDRAEKAAPAAPAIPVAPAAAPSPAGPATPPSAPAVRTAKAATAPSAPSLPRAPKAPKAPAHGGIALAALPGEPPVAIDPAAPPALPVIDEDDEPVITKKQEKRIEEISKKMEALGARLQKKDISDKERAEIERQLAESGKEIARSVMPIVRQSLKMAMPQIKSAIQMGLSMGKGKGGVDVNEILSQVDREIGSARKDLGDVPPELRRDIEGILQEVLSEVKSALREAGQESGKEKRSSKPEKKRKNDDKEPEGFKP